MVAYVLTAEADGDLDDIFDYTSERWSSDQAHKYLLQLEGCVEKIALGEARFKGLPDIFPRLRQMRCQHHYIFCLPRDNEPALIVAIFHERMDMLSRIADRLK